MTSLDPESKGGESVSDYDEHWDSENWGDMEVRFPPIMGFVHGCT